MSTTPKIILTKLNFHIGGKNYVVSRTMNTMRHDVGTKLSKNEVEQLVNDPSINVEIKAER
jgi:hypothetical protein